MSTSIYQKGECEEMKMRSLQFNHYFGNMGTNFDESGPPFDKQKRWTFPSPGTVGYSLLEFMCEYKKILEQ